MVLLVTIASFAVLVGLIGFYLEATEHWEQKAARGARQPGTSCRRYWDS